MEVVMHDMSYRIKKKDLDKVIVEHLELTCREGEIISFLGRDVSYIKDLFLLKKRPSQGELILDGVKIKRTNHILHYNGIDKMVGVLDDAIFFAKNKVEDYMDAYMDTYVFKVEDRKKHMKDALKIVGLSVSFLNREIQTLSFVEKKKVQFATVMSVNPKIILLDTFDYGLSSREKDYFKKLLLKLTRKYHKIIFLFNSSIPFLFDIVDKLYVIHKGKVKIAGDKTIFYNYNLYKYVDIPPIVSFTKYVLECGYAIDKYTDIKELIKELYRRIK